MSRHLISRRRFLSLPLAVFLAQVGRRPAQGWAATSPPRKGAYTADVGILYGLLTFRLEGVLTDPVYEGKSMAALIDLVRSGRIAPGSRVLYAHLGGQPALNAYAGVF